MTTTGQPARSRPHEALPGRDYHSPEIFELERERIFHEGWYCIAREEDVARPGDFLTAEVIDESVLLVRGREGRLRAFHNVCRHRGSQLCEGSGSFGSLIHCPYHAWGYSLEGRLVATPHVSEEEGLDRDCYGLLTVCLETWEGFVFVAFGSPPPLDEYLAAEHDAPLAYDRYGVGDLRVGARFVYEVRANWKIIIDNFNECLHCPRVHPELVRIVPLYRQGKVEEDDGHWGTLFAEGASSFATDGVSGLPTLPGLTEDDCRRYFGYTLFPNLMVSLLPDAVSATRLTPRAPDHTTVVSEYLFRPETIAAPGFDPSRIAEFGDLVSRQDWTVCEGVQRGIRSRAFDRGVLPSKDRLVHLFAERYLAARDG